MWSLTQSLMDLLCDNDAEIAGMTLITLSFLFLHKSHILMSTPIALQLAEALLPLFDHNNNQVQVLSIKLFRSFLGNAALCGQVHDLKKLVKEQKLWKFSECLLAEDRSRAAEHLRRALRYLQSPQEPLREAAISFMGMAGRRLRGQQRELQLICTALEDKTNDISLAVGSLAIQTLCILKSGEQAPISSFQWLRNHLRRAWKTRPRVSRLGCLPCRSSVES
ncbi:uncharacterized protein LOC129046604 [Molothrus ater]|uniref:uncharacterized protein LOC129046604 n=1 Tax=Molothrus ater TaxID=84834 RepID=UPI0023E77986|nr:uncharacterized protein LOC129046604 [Molothrus ater]